MREYVLCLAFAIAGLTAPAQMPHQSSSAEIQQEIKKLGVLGNVLYLAAHPDDENTRFIAYSANEKLYDTAYLSLTRGDGGQNLVGPEIREELGIIRTQELLAARRTDGGHQYFSRAIDFGYSKTASETLEIWDNDKILSDVVRVIRQFRPDVIVCRFPVDGGGGHGHHTASAILGVEAFELAADPSFFPEQVADLGTWQALRIVVNTGRWWNPDISDEEADVVSLDVGAYNSLLGTSYTELSARSRTQHKSQGFGSTGERGEKLEYFEHLKGEMATGSLFDGMTTDWSRVKGAEAIAQQVARLVSTFRPETPGQSIPDLLRLRTLLEGLEDDYWREKKLADVKALIKECAGLYVEAVADDHWAAAGDSITIRLEVNPRAYAGVEWIDYSLPALKKSRQLAATLGMNKKAEETIATILPTGLPLSQPYWLEKEGTLGTYQVDDPMMIGRPENEPAILADIRLKIDGQEITFSTPVVYKWNDPVNGELYRPFSITPPVFLTFSESSHLFAGEEEKEIELTVKSISGGIDGTIELQSASGWDIRPRNFKFSSSKEGEEQKFKIMVKPLRGAAPIDIRARMRIEGKMYQQSLSEIVYDHIPDQVYMPDAKTHLVYVDIQKRGDRIGYITGAGDVVPDALRGIGYQVDELTEADMTADDLKRYDAIVTGIRLLNVDERIDYYMPTLLEYCEQGGTLVLQYNTRHRLKTDHFSPYPITLSRDRVTEEDAEVRFLLPDHPVLNEPNKIDLGDFDGWVQERGLYFPSEWDQDKYAAILSWNDKGETPKDGSLLVAEYGSGHYVYSGISFFRELPAGVPGAYRLLVNLISLGNE